MDKSLDIVYSIAYQVLSEQRQRASFVRETLDKYASLSRTDLSEHDLSRLTRIVLGVVSTYGYLDQVIDAYTSSQVKLDAKLRDCLRIAVFEILYMRTSYKYAAFQGVELVRSVESKNQGAAQLANAILRGLAQDERDSMRSQICSAEAETASFAEYVHVSGMPAWLLKKIKKSQGDSYKDLALSQLDPAGIWLFVRPEASGTQEAFADAGYELQKTALPFVWRVANPFGIARVLECVADDVYVSDLAADAVAFLACPAQDAKLLEIGQGRATKTVVMKGITQHYGRNLSVVGVDSVGYKTKVAQKRTEALYSDVTCVTFDATKLDEPPVPESLEGTFDVVFCDVPCTGTGTMRRHPEIVWSVQPDALNSNNPNSLVSLQYDILTAAATKVRDGGYLIYATCSVLREENNLQIKRFLTSVEGAQFEVVDVCELAEQKPYAPELTAFMQAHKTEEGFFQTVPSPGECDGHFACVLKKR